MWVSNYLRAVFLIVFVFLFGSAYAGHIKPCCACNTTCNAECTCGCPCDGVQSGTKACLKKIDADVRFATFTEGTPDGKEFKVPLLDNDVLEDMKPGDCGFIRLQSQVMCTGFKKDSGMPGQQSTGQSGKKF
jgi:hypothetical protein